MEGKPSKKSGLHFLYIQTRTIDVQPIKFQRLKTFIVTHGIQHVAIGLIDPQSQSGRKICGVNPHSVMVQHFLLKLPQGVKVSAHPYDGFAHPQWPFRYRELKGLNAVLRYVWDMNNLLKNLNSKVLFSGLVLGQSMGGKPYKNNAQTVQLFRSAMEGAGLKHFTLGASPGGPGFGLDESYYQCYDWTPYSSKNPNLWIAHRNNPQNLFNSVIHANSGWNGEQNLKIPWSETKNYYKVNQNKWKWEIVEEGTKRKHFMWALNVPQGDKKRLSAWSEEGIMKFYSYVKKQMKQGKTGFRTALYLDKGLEYFA